MLLALALIAATAPRLARGQDNNALEPEAPSASAPALPTATFGSPSPADTLPPAGPPSSDPLAPGSTAAPLSPALDLSTPADAEPPSPSVFRRWWFWTAVGAAAAATVAIIIVSSGGDAPPATDLGNQEFRP